MHSFFTHDQALWSPIRQSLSLQSLIQLSHEIGRRSNCADSLSKQFCSNEGRQFSIGLSETGIRMEELNSKVRGDKRVDNNEHNPDEISRRMINIRPQTSAKEQQELYRIKDETSWSQYDYDRENMRVEHHEDKKRKTDAGNYNYDYAVLPPCNISG
ncbi:hypothetical protein ACJMK2_026360 [Sinanodonta woodiana]|uniref:Uncharacterized protein n=1 Tax=Sinanodonta woodiana TaxID=1069815 RepID=A0ABD3XJU7_SINWO